MFDVILAIVIYVAIGLLVVASYLPFRVSQRESAFIPMTTLFWPSAIIFRVYSYFRPLKTVTNRLYLWSEIIGTVLLAAVVWTTIYMVLR
jgi:hypothetical protein